jgi:hypothetical protein
MYVLVTLDLLSKYKNFKKKSSKLGSLQHFFFQKIFCRTCSAIFLVSKWWNSAPKNKNKMTIMSHIKGCSKYILKTLCYLLLFVWNCVIGCEYVVSLIDHTTSDNYKVIFIVTLSLGPSLTQNPLFHLKFECSPKWL